jgi:hypothetical protein
VVLYKISDSKELYSITGIIGNPTYIQSTLNQRSESSKSLPLADPQPAMALTKQHRIQDGGAGATRDYFGGRC